MTKLRKVNVRLLFGHTIQEKNKKHIVREIEVIPDGSETISQIKQKIAEALGGKVKADDLLLYFGPNDKKVGKQYAGDPAVDENKLLLSDFSILGWLDLFPHWTLGARPLPATPPPPGVATHRAAALAEGKDPDKAVADARAKGEIPSITELPAPWGPKPYAPLPEDSSYKPPAYRPAPPTKLAA